MCLHSYHWVVSNALRLGCGKLHRITSIRAYLRTMLYQFDKRRHPILEVIPRNRRIGKGKCQPLEESKV